MRWDEWRGAMDGRPTLWVKHLLCGRGYHVDVHKMVASDDPACFHTHPAYAVRFILWGGYVEELENGAHKIWRPGMIGIVRPECSHRIAELRNGRVSYSLWMRFRKTARVYLRGEGWCGMDQTYRVADTVIEGLGVVAMGENRIGMRGNLGRLCRRSIAQPNNINGAQPSHSPAKPSQISFLGGVGCR